MCITPSRSAVPPDVILRAPRRPEGDIETELRAKGFTDLQIDLLKYLCSFPSGFIVMTGPTGSRE